MKFDVNYPDVIEYELFYTIKNILSKEFTKIGYIVNINILDDDLNIDIEIKIGNYITIHIKVRNKPHFGITYFDTTSTYNGYYTTNDSKFVNEICIAVDELTLNNGYFKAEIKR